MFAYCMVTIRTFLFSLEMQYWTDEMKKIMRKEFQKEFQNLERPIRKRKLEKCRKRFLKECSRHVSTSSIKGSIHHERKKTRNE